MTEKKLSAADQNAIQVAASLLTHVMENYNVLQWCITNQVPSNQQNTIMTLKENQAENVLASIRSQPPLAPRYLTYDEQPISHTMVQPPIHTNEEFIDHLPDRSITNDNHDPPGELNSRQKIAYQICSIYLSYESR